MVTGQKEEKSMEDISSAKLIVDIHNHYWVKCVSNDGFCLRTKTTIPAFIF